MENSFELLNYLAFLSRTFWFKYHSLMRVEFGPLSDYELLIRINTINDYHFSYCVTFKNLEELHTIIERFEKDYVQISLKEEN